MVKRRASDGGGFVAQRRYFISSIVSILLRQRLYFTYDYYHENRQAYGGGEMVRCASILVRPRLLYNISQMLRRVLVQI